MKNLFLLLILFLLVGCVRMLPAVTNVPSPEPAAAPVSVAEQVLFNEALDQLSATHSLAGLKGFQERFAESPWGERAETIVLYVEEVNQRKAQLEQVRNEQLQLQAENQQLIEKIEQLKSLLIELEQRPQ